MGADLFNIRLQVSQHQASQARAVFAKHSITLSVLSNGTILHVANTDTALAALLQLAQIFLGVDTPPAIAAVQFGSHEED